MALPIYENNEFLQSAVQSLGSAFKALFNGDIGGMLVHLMGVVPLFATFFIIWKLMEFVFIISIFKDQEHRKYASNIGIGIALIGMMTPTVSNLILKLLSGTLVKYVVIVIAVSIGIMLIYYARKKHFEAAQGISESRTAATQSRRGRKKQKHEEKLEDDLRERENNTIQDIDKLIKKNWWELGNSITLIDRMIQYLAKADSLGNSPQAKEKFQENLVKASNAATARIKEEYLDTENLKQKIVELDNFEMKTWEIHIDEGKLEKSLEKQFREGITKSGLTADEKKERRKELHIVPELENKLLYWDQQRKILRKETKKFLGRIEDLEKESILELKNQLTGYIHASDFPSAINVLHKIKSELLEVKKDEQSVYNMERKIVSYENSKNKLEKQMNNALDRLTGKSYSKGKKWGRRLGWVGSGFKGRYP